MNTTQPGAQVIDLGTEASAARAREIRELHGAVERAEKLTDEKRIRIGQLLVEQKKANKGTFMAWVKANCNFHPITAASYMRAYWEGQISQGQHLTHLPTVNGFFRQHMPAIHDDAARKRVVQQLLAAVNLPEWPKLVSPDMLQKLVDAAEVIRKDRATRAPVHVVPKFVGYQQRLADAGLMNYAAGSATRKARLAELLRLAGLSEYPKGPLMPEIEDKLVKAVEIMKARKEVKETQTTLTEMKITVPESKQAQFDKALAHAVAIETARLQAEFAGKVAAAVAEERAQLSAARAKVTDQLHDLIEQRKHVDEYLTQDEFKLIRSCLHPDREADPERKRRAFDLFSRFETRVSSDARSRKRNGWLA